jgi:hypothetical protein
MRILGITSPQSGVGYHRIIMPVAHMQKEYAMLTDTVTDEIVDNNYDIFLMNRYFTGVTIEQVLEMRKKYGFKLVVDNDDFWRLDPFHVLYSRYADGDITNKILEYVRAADLCTVTHERLADEVYKYNKNVEIIPNALPYGEEQFLDNKIESDLVRLFWAGSGTHEHDLKILKNPMRKISQLSRIKSVIAGYNDAEQFVWNKMSMWFSNNYNIPTQIYRFTEVFKYMAAYADSDISLIPLVESTFNSMKSNLKVLETAAKKNPAIVSNVHPYKDMPVLYVNKQSDWFKHTRDLVHDKAMRDELGLKLYEYCNANYSLKHINNKRYDIYSKLL